MIGYKWFQIMFISDIKDITLLNGISKIRTDTKFYWRNFFSSLKKKHLAAITSFCFTDFFETSFEIGADRISETV